MAIPVKLIDTISRKMRRALDVKYMKRAHNRTIHEIGVTLVKTCKAGIKESQRDGEWYRYPGLERIGGLSIPRAGNMTQASVQFGYPAKQTGRLGRSIAYTKLGSTMFFGSKFIHTTLTQYPAILQPSGDPDTPIGSAGERPFLTFAHRTVAPTFGMLMERNINKLL